MSQATFLRVDICHRVHSGLIHPLWLLLGAGELSEALTTVLDGRLGFFRFHDFCLNGGGSVCDGSLVLKWQL
jgi:hypothetical protein